MRSSSVKVYKKIQSRLLRNKVRVDSLKVLSIPDKRFMQRKPLGQAKREQRKSVKKSRAHQKSPSSSRRRASISRKRTRFATSWRKT